VDRYSQSAKREKIAINQETHIQKNSSANMMEKVRHSKINESQG
jgi:hypothetical protein